MGKRKHAKIGATQAGGRDRLGLRRRGAVALGVLAAVASLPAARSAGACSPPSCTLAITVPNVDWMPSNLIYFEVLDATGPFSLHTALGRPIAASVRTLGSDLVFGADEQVVEDVELVLEYPDSCGRPHSFAFTTSPFQRLQLGPPRLWLMEKGVRRSIPDAAESPFLRVRYQHPDTTSAATHLMSHSATIDGLPRGLPNVGGVLELELNTRCTPPTQPVHMDSCDYGFGQGLDPGVHEIEVQTHVLGVEAQPEPARLRVELECPTEAESAALGGALEEGALEEGAEVPTSDAGSGCALSLIAGEPSSTSERAGSGALGSWAAACLMGAAIRARRRRAR